jgi:predicted Rossmann fold flavoprotein
VLQISSYWRDGDIIEIDWAPAAPEDMLARLKRERPKAQLKTGLNEFLPERLAVALLGESKDAILGEHKDAALVDIMRALKSFALKPAGTEGYAKAEVTVGGVDTDALSQQTMECRAASGLFFIGECVDVTGWLGGYNFQWAWSSGWAAGQAI